MYKPLVTVHLWSGLRSLVGKEAVEVRASNVGQMLAALEREHPALADAIDLGVSVSIDGKIYAFGLTEKVDETKEIYLLQRITGG